LATTSNVDIAEPQAVDDYLGVDLGVANLASDSDGRRYSGSEVKNVRWRNRKLRARLQAKQTRSAKRRLKKLAGGESRFARHVNHCISKQIVRTAKGTGRGIRREDLNGIRTRVKVRHGERGVLHADINAADNIRQGRCKEVESDVVQNRLSHSLRFRRLSAAVTSPHL